MADTLVLGTSALCVRVRVSPPAPYGEMSEWFKELVLKTSEGNTSVGSNPTLSANIGMWLSLVERLIWVQDAAGSNPVIPTSQRWLFACLFDNQKGYISNKYIRDEKPSTQGGNALHHMRM